MVLRQMPSRREATEMFPLAAATAARMASRVVSFIASERGATPEVGTSGAAGSLRSPVMCRTWSRKSSGRWACVMQASVFRSISRAALR